ncbi:hypothetical protein BTVI_43603 [Pitangus sulphuratus]|nr:hypothetical protein BTVI_43603 [Pitangus sulphuratus]
MGISAWRAELAAEHVLRDIPVIHTLVSRGAVGLASTPQRESWSVRNVQRDSSAQMDGAGSTAWLVSSQTQAALSVSPALLVPSQLKPLCLASPAQQDQGSASCLPCRAGHYCSSEHTSLEVMLLAMVCPAGLLCPGGQADVPDPTENACPRGYYCPQGDTGLHAQPCPNGTFGEQRGLSSAEECSPCPAGKYCYTDGMEPPGIPHPTGDCPPGYNCPPGTGFPFSFPCMPGSFWDNSSTEGEDVCKPSPPGHYCDSPAMAQPKPCPAGFYCVQGSSKPEPCPEGTSSAKQGLSGPSECSPCARGFYCAAPGQTGPTGPCEAGFYCQGSALTPECLECPPGWGFHLEIFAHKDITARLAPSTHKRCRVLLAPGMGREGPRMPLGACPVPLGFSATHLAKVLPWDFVHQEQVSQTLMEPQTRALVAHAHLDTSAQLAQASHRDALWALTQTGTRFATEFPCPRGYYNPDPMTQSLDSCLPCPPGHYCGKEGLTAASGQCDAGYYCDSQQGPVIDFTLYPCPRGFYCPPGTSRSSQYSCPAGTFGPRQKLRTIQECQKCPAGKYCESPGLAAPTGDCAEGFWCKSGARGITVDLQGSPTLQDPAGLGFTALEVPPAQHLRMVLRGTRAPGELIVLWALPSHSHVLLATTAAPLGILGSRIASCVMQGISVMGLDLSLQVDYVRLDSIAVEEPFLLNLPEFCALKHHPGDLQENISQGVVKPEECPAGYYCLPGTKAAHQYPCPEGTYSNQTGLGKPRDCKPCPGGTFCASAGPGAHTPELCPAGHFCLPGTNLSTQHPCPKGTFGPRTGATRESDCEPCPAGMYCSAPGLSQPSGFCYPGYHCAKGAISPAPFKHRVESSSLALPGNDICPVGHFCPRGTGYPVPCPPGSFSPSVGLEAEEQCQPCPAGHYCSGKGLSELAQTSLCHPGHGHLEGKCAAGYFCLAGSSQAAPQGHSFSWRFLTGCRWGQVCAGLCPAGFYCLEGSEVPTPCPANTLRDLPGAVRREDCLPCPPGHWCKAGDSQAYPCPPGHYCSGGSGSEHGSLVAPQECPPQTFRRQPGARSPADCQPCPPGYHCPVSGLTRFEDYPCPPGYWCPGSVNPKPCRPGLYCGALTGATSCTCHGLNRAFQQSDASCICQAGYVYYDERGKKDPDSNSDQDCRPQVDELCAPGQVRLAATRRCVVPERHDCSPACGRAGGELHAELGICHCKQYISAEELCDQLCLLRAPRISLAFGINRELLLRMGEGEVREVANVLGPDEHVQNSQRVHLVLFSPSGVLGFIVSSTDVLDAFLMGDFPSGQLLQKDHRFQRSSSKDTQALPLVPNPVVCLEAGDTILFQLSIDSQDRASSHYPVYQKQHLYNSNPSWDFGPFRRLNHLIQETHLNLSWFAHVFLESGTYVFRDSTVQEHFLIVTVNEANVSCDPRAVPFQPSSLFQLARHGVLKQQGLNLAPNWAAITATLFVLGSFIVVLTTLAIVFQPAGPASSPLKGWKPRWRSLGEPHIPPEYILLKDSLQFYQMLGPRGSGGDAASGEKGTTPNAGGPLARRVLEDFSVRTLYDKLEDQNLHVASQLAKHRMDVLVFYNGISHRLQSLVVSGKKDLREGSLGNVTFDMVQALDPDALKTFARQRLCGHKPADKSGAAEADEQCAEHCGNTFQPGSLGAPWQEVRELMKALEVLLGNAPCRNGAVKGEMEHKVQAQHALEVVPSLGSLASDSKSEVVEGQDHELPQQCELFSRKDVFFSLPGCEEQGLDLQLPYLTELEVEGLVAASPLAKTLCEIKQALVNLQEPPDLGNPGEEGSQEAVSTPLLKDHSIVTPKFLAQLKKCEDSKVLPARAENWKIWQKEPSCFWKSHPQIPSKALENWLPSGDAIPGFCVWWHINSNLLSYRNKWANAGVASNTEVKGERVFGFFGGGDAESQFKPEKTEQRSC